MAFTQESQTIKCVRILILDLHVVFTGEFDPDFMSWSFQSPAIATIRDESTVTLLWTRPTYTGTHQGAPLVYTTYWRDSENPTWQQFVSVSEVIV